LKPTLVVTLTWIGVPSWPTRPCQCVAVLWNEQPASASAASATNDDEPRQVRCMRRTFAVRGADATPDVA
jgi:hypothetical protein